MKYANDPQERWDNFWKEILVLPDGSIDIEQLKKELSDFSMLIRNIPSIYMEATGGMVSNPTTDPDVVISLIHDHINEVCNRSIKEYCEDNDLEFTE